MLRPFQEFARTGALGGVVLLACSAVALAWANSPWADSYFALWTRVLSVGPASAPLAMSAQHWINDALMAVFFLLVGLEIKRELLVGELASPRQAALPVIAAAGGMLVPALVYSSHLSWPALGAAAMIVVGLMACNARGVRSLVLYLGLGILLWLAILASGIHATVAGVVLALTIPARIAGDGDAPLLRLEHSLQRPVAFAIMPLFALANAGVRLGEFRDPAGGAIAVGESPRLDAAKYGVLGGSVIAGAVGYVLLRREKPAGGSERS